MWRKTLSTHRGAVEKSGQYFLKTYRNDVELEFNKSQQIYDIAVRTGEFVAPKPISLNLDRSQIAFDFITEPLVSIREPFIAAIRSTATPSDACQSLFRKVGRSIGLIHKYLTLPTASEWSVIAPDGEDTSSYQGALIRDLRFAHNSFLHCDFGFSNLFFVDDEEAFTQKLVVLDPSPNYFVTFKADCYGPSILDLANIAACMQGLFPVRRQLSCKWLNAGILLGRVLEEYENITGQKLDRDLLRRSSEFTLKRYLRTRLPTNFLRKLAFGLVANTSRTAEIESGLYE